MSVSEGKTNTSAAAKIAASSAWNLAPRKCACGYLAFSSSSAGPSPTTTLEPGRSRRTNASMFFSTATRPTLRKMGRASPSSGSRSPSRRGRNCSVSTPRVQKDRLRKPRFSSSSRMVGVATITRPDGLWNQRMKA